jgi:hypothetical protein
MIDMPVDHRRQVFLAVNTRFRIDYEQYFSLVTHFTCSFPNICKVSHYRRKAKDKSAKRAKEHTKCTTGALPYKPQALKYREKFLQVIKKT